MLPVAQWWSVTKPATIDRGSKVGEITDPISSTETPQPTVRGAISIFPSSHPVFLQHLDIQLDPPKVFLQFAIPHPRSEWITVTFCVCKSAVESVGLIVFSVLQYRTCETWNYVEYSSPLVYSKFLL